jgi:hypothetical protein
MQDTSTPPPPRWTLRQLPLAARLTLAAYLIAVGLGYLSALVNLHFQEARPDEILPSDEDVVTIYSGKSQVSQLERLLVAHPSLPFNGQGSMRGSMTGVKSSGWKGAVKKKAKELKLDLNIRTQAKQAEAAVQEDLDGERLSLIAWIKAGPDKEAYEKDAYVRGPKLAAHPINPKFLNDDNSVKIKSIIHARCARCHSPDVGGPGSNFPLDEFDQIAVYTSAEKSTGKSLPKLAMTTHVHLLSFAVLYALTGLILALSSCPAWVRVPIAPLALIASVVDVACWWLARLEDPYGSMFAMLIPVTGAVLAVSLLLQIVLSLFSLFGNVGKVLLVLLFIAAGAGGYMVNENYINPHILHEKEMRKAVQE